MKKQDNKVAVITGGDSEYTTRPVPSSRRNFYESEIIEIQDETHNIKRFFFRVPHVKEFDFKPGQFVMLDLPIESKVTNRSYSIASSPVKDNIFELLIVLNPPGIGTPYIWNNYRVGSKVPVAGPLGKFLLHEDNLQDDVCFICTGTGIAPFRSMITNIYDHNIAHRNMYLIFGSRKKEDLLYKKEFADYEAKHPEFKFIPVLSRETPETWDGRHGYVHPVYEELFADKRPAYFYICGWKAMVREARERLLELGYPKERIKLELFD